MKIIQMETQMRHAFSTIKVKASAYTKNGKVIAALISKALETKAGISNIPEWNASLSFPTYRALKAEGIML